MCDVHAARIGRCSRGLRKASNRGWAAGDAGGWLLHGCIRKTVFGGFNAKRERRRRRRSAVRWLSISFVFAGECSTPLIPPLSSLHSAEAVNSDANQRER
jgi:hypothetical protein